MYKEFSMDKRMEYVNALIDMVDRERRRPHLVLPLLARFVDHALFLNRFSSLEACSCYATRVTIRLKKECISIFPSNRFLCFP